MMRHVTGRGGFSLVELLVAISVLTVGLLAVANMQTVAFSNSSVSHKLMVASELAKEAMEDIMAWDPSHPQLNTSASDVPYASNVAVSGGGSFNITYTTQTNTPSFGTTRVEVTVREAGTFVRGMSPIVLTGFRRVV